MRFTWFVLLLLWSHAAPAFEIAEFKTGMTKDKVREQLKDWNFDRIQEFSASTLLAYDLPEKRTNRQFTFSFCNDRLVGFEQALKPSLKNFIIVANNYIKSNGQPYKTEANTSVLSAGEKNLLALFWRSSNEIIGVKFIVLNDAEQLSNVYEAPNTCWAIPR